MGEKNKIKSSTNKKESYYNKIKKIKKNLVCQNFSSNQISIYSNGIALD
jgi:hypothetical protein